MENFDMDIKKTLAQMPWLPDGAFLAGGALTSTFTNRPIRDFDLYFKTKEAFVDALSEAFEDGMYCVAITERAVTFVQSGDNVAIQFMSFAWFPTAQDIFDKYDFTCCMAAVDLDTKEFSRHPTFLTDCSKRILKFNAGTEFPIGSALRVKKYEAKGFSIEASEYLKVILAVSFKNPQNWKELANQVGGQYGAALKIDESTEFNVHKAIEVLASAIDNVSMESNAQPDQVDSYEQAIEKIFGKEDADIILKDKPPIKQNNILRVL